jgi:pyruvate carboxylase
MTPLNFSGYRAAPTARPNCSPILATSFSTGTEVKGKAIPSDLEVPAVPVAPDGEPPAGTRQLLQKLGPKKFAAWARKEKRLLLTDTTFRDAHQSLMATRVRTHDLLAMASAISHRLPNLFSIEMWGGATFDTSMRFLHEDPWHRLRALRERIPNICFQMLLRGANAVGYGSYPDNVIVEFVREAAAQGIDIFRIFDSLNSIENMRVSIDAALESGAVCEPAICYTGDLLDNSRPKYSARVYQHEIPGGQYTNLREQATAMGLGHRWREVEKIYADVNRLFGDIVKVTPSSKVVGDMTLFLMAKEMQPADILKLDENHDVSFPNSVVEMFSGGLGFPLGGWPKKLKKIVLRGQAGLRGKPSARLAPVKFAEGEKALEQKLGHAIRREDLLSALLYPDVFAKYDKFRQTYSDVASCRRCPFSTA